MSRMADYEDLWAPDDEWADDHDCLICKYHSLSVSDEPCATCAFQDKWESADDDPDWTPSQAAKADAGKPRITLVPRRIIWDIAAVRQYGVEIKYPETGVDGWRTIGKERIRDAMCRHMLRYLEDPDGVDEESGLPHLWHLATNVAFLCELEDSDDNP